MTARDRLVLAVLLSAAIVFGMWVELVSPKRSDANSLQAQVATVQSQLNTDRSALAQDRTAAASYSGDVAMLNNLATAVPASDELPALIRSLQTASEAQNISFQVINVTSAGGAGQGFTPLNFSFTFAGSYLNLQHFLHALDDNTVVNNGQVQANGRLFTVNSVELAPNAAEPGQATASVTATAYMQSGASSGSTGATGATP